MLVLGMLGFLGSGLLLSGCKSAPDLSKADAQAMIQAKYDQTPAVGTEITVDINGLARGVTAKYWARTKLYPNNYWADFTLTPEGKKVVKLQNDGDVIQWRPENAGDKNFTVVVVTVAANHMKVHDVGDPQSDVGGTKSVDYVATESLEGVPNDLQIIAGGPGNKLSNRHVATFALDGAAWKLQSNN
jgi:hypothetical protein